MILKQSITQSTCHSEGEARRISYKAQIKACKRSFAYAQDDIFRHSVPRYGICQCWLFHNWGLCNPKPRTKYSFFFIAKKKERTLDKKEKQRRLKTVTKFNSKLVNSLLLKQHEFSAVSLSDCSKFVIFAS